MLHIFVVSNTCAIEINAFHFRYVAGDCWTAKGLRAVDLSLTAVISCRLEHRSKQCEAVVLSWRIQLHPWWFWMLNRQSFHEASPLLCGWKPERLSRSCFRLDYPAPVLFWSAWGHVRRVRALPWPDIMHLSFFWREVTTQSGPTAHADRYPTDNACMSDSKLHSKPKVRRMQKYAIPAL